MTTTVNEIRTALKKAASTSHKELMGTMVPGNQFTYGVKTPVLNELAKKYKEGSFKLAALLWDGQSYEEKIIAIKIMEKTGRQDPERLLKLFTRFSKDIDNWAVCDGLGMLWLRSIVKTHATEIFKLAEQLAVAENFWLRRLSLVMVEWYTRDPAYHTRIRKLVVLQENDPEYYVKKAVQWLNRNLAKER